MNQIQSQPDQSWVTAEFATASRVKQIAKRLNGLGFEFQIIADEGKFRVLVPAEKVHDVMDGLSNSSIDDSNLTPMSSKEKRTYRQNVSILVGIMVGSLIGSTLSFALGLPSAFSATIIGLSAFFFSVVSYSIFDPMSK